MFEQLFWRNCFLNAFGFPIWQAAVALNINAEIEVMGSWETVQSLVIPTTHHSFATIPTEILLICYWNVSINRISRNDLKGKPAFGGDQCKRDRV